MAEINLITTARRYIDFAECNHSFLSRVIRQKKEAQYLDIAQLNNQIRYATHKLKMLTPSQLAEWKDIHIIKLKQLAALFTSHQHNTRMVRQTNYKQYSTSIREELQLLVAVCRQLAIDYDSQTVAEIIQDFYFLQYNEPILQLMEQVGYNINRLRDLHYYQSSLWSLCCCWQGR